MPAHVLTVQLRQSDYQTIGAGARLFERFQMSVVSGLNYLSRSRPCGPDTLDSVGKPKNLSAHAHRRFSIDFVDDFGARRDSSTHFPNHDAGRDVGQLHGAISASPDDYSLETVKCFIVMPRRKASEL